MPGCTTESTCLFVSELFAECIWIPDSTKCINIIKKLPWDSFHLFTHLWTELRNLDLKTKEKREHSWNALNLLSMLRKTYHLIRDAQKYVAPHVSCFMIFISWSFEHWMGKLVGCQPRCDALTYPLKKNERLFLKRKIQYVLVLNERYDLCFENKNFLVLDDGFDLCLVPCVQFAHLKKIITVADWPPLFALIGRFSMFLFWMEYLIFVLKRKIQYLLVLNENFDHCLASRVQFAHFKQIFSVADWHPLFHVDSFIPQFQFVLYQIWSYYVFLVPLYFLSFVFERKFTMLYWMKDLIFVWAFVTNLLIWSKSLL